MTGEIEEQVSLAPYTTFKTGGTARYFVTVQNEADLKMAVTFAQAKQLPFFVLGGGSNVLVPDEGYTGVVIHMQLVGRTYTDVSATLVAATFGAGEIFDSVVADSIAQGLWGLENLSSIPGTVGATPVQNVGAYGVEVADCITAVTVFNATTMRTEIFEPRDCAFGYRDSLFKHLAGQGLIIIAVTFTLSRIAQPQLSYADLAGLADTRPLTADMIRTRVIAIRQSKFPDWGVVGTAGSFFKNPIVTRDAIAALVAEYPALPVYPQSEELVKVSLGFILDKICGLRGYHKNHCALYENQALVLIATAGATTSEVITFAREVAHIVFEKTKITIECEVTVLT